MAERSVGMLEGYRALDLTNEIGFACGKFLGVLGVDVIKVERPGGDPSRMIPPFVGETPDPERSLYWWAFNTDKRGITLDIEKIEGQVLFRKLVATADFVIESFKPGYLDSLGLGYKDLSKINPRIIMTSITPFGQEGPYSHWKGSELIASALSGVMLGNGDPDRAPVREGPDSICLLANASALAGTMMAHYHRQMTGEGQQVDVSLQHASATRGGGGGRDSDRPGPKRNSIFRNTDGKPTRVIWPCKDGWISWKMMPGMVGAPANRALSKWMDDAGMVNPLAEITNWDTLNIAAISQELLDAMHDAIGEFFLTLTKKEIAEEGLKRGINAAVVNDPSDVLTNPQLQARDFWKELQHPESTMPIRFPRYFFLSNETQNFVKRRATMIGEHNEEIYNRELGLSRAEIMALEAANVL